ncbi:MAG: hypothetical protein AAFX39_12625 [Pseudomonadota bacterium]
MSDSEVKELAQRMTKVEIKLAEMNASAKTLRWVVITLISVSAVASPVMTAVLLR